MQIIDRNYDNHKAIETRVAQISKEKKISNPPIWLICPGVMDTWFFFSLKNEEAKVTQ